MPTLFERSISLILEHQAPSGAYVASPTFATYDYSWFRDGSFIAHAMDRVGQPASAAAFHRWAGAVLLRYSAKLERLLERQAAGQPIALDEQMHTRFTVDGIESPSQWTNFQLDGYGTWLWSLIEHVRRYDDRALYSELRQQVALLARYLAAFWDTPCYDCWEEFGDKLHSSTLAALYGGLQALADYDPELVPPNLPGAIREFVLEQTVAAGSLIKFVGSSLVDASLISAATPYRLLAPDDRLMRATVARIEAELRRGGICRYCEDTYYGGGAWLLLTAWLGWYYAETGQLELATAARDWVAAQADVDALLPEQITHDLLSPEHYEPWIQRWGPIAHPLLWSHAMYLILETELQASAGGGATR